MYATINDNKIRFPPAYKLNTLLEEYVYKGVRLLFYHLELNVIERIWGLVQNWLAATFRMANVQKILGSAKGREGAKISNHIKKYEVL